MLCFVDTETTGLDPRIHQPYEVCMWRENEDAPATFILPHTLELADPHALTIGRYFERCHTRASEGDDPFTLEAVTLTLRGVTLVGSNPAFDAAMLTRVIGTPVWSHRLINVAEGAMWVFGWDEPRGLAKVADACRERGHVIPEPDHTAEGDVRATRAVYYALREERAKLGGAA